MIYSNLKTLCNFNKSQTNRIVLRSHYFLGRRLEVSMEGSGRLRGWVIARKIREVQLKGLLPYLPLETANRLLDQSYLKFQKDAIEVLPKGLGGMKRTKLRERTGKQEEESTKTRRETLDLSGKDYKTVYKALKKLKSSSTVEYLNLSGCSNLNNNDLQKVTKINTLKEIDLSGCGNVGAHMIKKLLDANQNVERLILEGNAQITREDLRAIYMSRECLQYINLKGCKQLRDEDVINAQGAYLSCLVLPSGKEIKTWRKLMQVPVPAVSDIYSLIEVIADDFKRRIVRAAVNELLDVNERLKWLNLYQNEIGNAGAQALAVALKMNQTIQMLSLDCNEIGAAGVQALAAALKVNRTLEQLNFYGNEIGAIGAQALAAALEGHPMLQTLDLRHNCIDSTGGQALGEAIRMNQTLQCLELSENQIGDAGVQVLAAGLQMNHSIQTLNLTSNEIGSAGAQALAAALKVNQTLRTLDLSQNKIGAAGAQALGEALQVNYTLQILGLADNQIGAAGVQALAAALKMNQRLPKLDLHLSGNQIGAAGAQALAGVLEVSQIMQRLYISDNQIGDAGAQALAAALKVNQTMQTLYLSQNQIGVTGVEALAAVLKVNQTLQSLDLSKNQIDDTSAQILGAVLEANHTLQTLDLNYNQISDKGVQALRDSLQGNQSLQWLNFAWNKISEAKAVVQNQANILLQANREMATVFQQKKEEVQNFLNVHQHKEEIVLQHLPQLHKLLQEWRADSIIPSIEAILIKSGRTHFNDRYRERLEGMITDLTDRLHELWLEPFERKVAALSNEYVMSKEPSKKRNVELGYVLYETWLTFFGSECPNWLEEYLQLLIPFGVLLDIAEGGEKKDISNLQNIHSLFERVLSFKKEK